MKNESSLSPVMRRVLLLGTSQLSRAALQAPMRSSQGDALADLQAAQNELGYLIECLQHQQPEGTRHESHPA